MKRIVTILVAVALVAGMVGCGEGNGNGEVSYQLTVSSTSGGSVVEPGEGVYTYLEGTIVNLAATPDAGYVFVNWTGGVGNVANVYSASTTITANDDYAVTANFEEIMPVKYELTVSSTSGGSVTTPGEGTFTYLEGALVDIVAAPDVGYIFVSWGGDMGAVEDVYSAVTTVAMNGDYSISAGFAEDEVVSFADPNLEAVVRDAIIVPERAIYRRDLEELTELQAGQKGIADLTGLEYATGLTELFLGENQISDVSPLAGLTRLRGLCLWGNRISDISPLERLTNLTWLHLEANQISDISPLADLTNLTKVGIMQNEISDLSPLDGLTRLGELSVSINSVSDIPMVPNLANLTALGLHIRQISDSELPHLADLTLKLRRLMLWGNQLSDISALADLTSLEALWLSDNQLSDISPLASLTRLLHLFISGNPISDISSLESLTNLTSLYLGANQISDISPLAGLTNLNQLGLWGNQISDISSLESLTNLTSLDLGSNQISDISPLASLTNLTKVGIIQNEISDLSPLDDLTRLGELSVSINSVSDIPMVPNLANLTALGLHIRQISDSELPHLADLKPKLTRLDLPDNRLSDISPLADLTGLTNLFLVNNRISDLSPLVMLINLTHLDLGGNRIADVSPLAVLTNLLWLHLGSNQISDISPLLDNAGLGKGDWIYLADNPLSEESINTHVPALRERGVTVHYWNGVRSSGAAKLVTRGLHKSPESVTSESALPP